MLFRTQKAARSSGWRTPPSLHTARVQSDATRKAWEGMGQVGHGRVWKWLLMEDRAVLVCKVRGIRCGCQNGMCLLIARVTNHSSCTDTRNPGLPAERSLHANDARSLLPGPLDPPLLAACLCDTAKIAASDLPPIPRGWPRRWDLEKK